MCEELTNTPALLLASLLKDFLRSLPEPLLSGNVQEWLNSASSGRIEHVRRLVSALSRENHLLLANVMCVLYQIAKRARYNLMSASNLGEYATLNVGSGSAHLAIAFGSKYLLLLASDSSIFIKVDVDPDLFEFVSLL